MPDPVIPDPAQVALPGAWERARAAIRQWPPSPAGMFIVVAVAAAYFAAARVGLRFAMPGGNVTPVWPPSGIALAAMLLLGSRVWPGVWLGSFAANFLGIISTADGASIQASLAFATGASTGAALTAWLGAVLTRRIARTGSPVERVRDLLAFVGLGGAVACLLSATNGVLWLGAAGLAPWERLGSIWLTWWLGDTAGVFVFAPLVIAWIVPASFPRRRRWAEAVSCFALLLTAGSIMFDGALLPTLGAGQFTFLIIPFLVWPALRLGQRGATAATLAVSCLAVWGTIHGEGPFVLATRNGSLLLLELFLSVVALSGLCVAAVATGLNRAEAERRIVLDELESRVRQRTAALDAEIAERKQAEDGLREAETRLRLSVAASNIGLWDWKLAAGDIYFSREWKSQLGYAEDELPNHFGEWESRVHPDDLAPTQAKLQHFLEDPAAHYATEIRLRHKDGSYRWIFTQAQLFRDGAGKPVRMLGCHVDITDRKRTEAALQDVVRRLLRAEDAERRRIAKELHDSTAQDLVSVMMNLGTLRDALISADKKPLQMLDDSIALVENSANDIRTLSYVLHPPRLEEMGLPGALTEYAAGFGRRMDIRIRVEAAKDFDRLPEELELVLFRVAQESLVNAVRHSRSDAATIRLARTDGRAMLEIEDYGCGMPPDDAAQPGAYGVGIIGMRERVHHLGGELEVESGAGGTIVRAMLPWRRERP